MWSVGAILELEDRSKMQDFIVNHDEFKLNLPTLTPGTEETIFDYFVDHDGESRKSVVFITFYLETKLLITSVFLKYVLEKQKLFLRLLKSKKLHAIKKYHEITGWYAFLKAYYDI